MKINKVYLIVNERGHIKGYASTRFTDKEDNLLSGYIEIENPSQDLLDNFIFYKVVKGEVVKMSDEEFKALYPNYDKVPETPEEIQNDFNIDMDYRMSCLELGRGE